VSVFDPPDLPTTGLQRRVVRGVSHPPAALASDRPHAARNGVELVNELCYVATKRRTQRGPSIAVIAVGAGTRTFTLSTCPPLVAVVKIDEMIMVRVVDGVIVEAWEVWERTTMRRNSPA
jgi:hypothetical protein